MPSNLGGWRCQNCKVHAGAGSTHCYFCGASRHRAALKKDGGSATRYGMLGPKKSAKGEGHGRQQGADSLDIANGPKRLGSPGLQETLGQPTDAELGKAIQARRAMIDLARGAGLSPKEIKEQELKLKELEERRAASRTLGKRFAEAHKRKEQLLKRLESERQHREDLEGKITKSMENTANLEHEPSWMRSLRVAPERKPLRNRWTISSTASQRWKTAWRAARGVRPTLSSRRCSCSTPSSKAGCGAHPLSADRDEDMLEEEDEEVRSAKNALQMAVGSAAKRRKAATPPRSTGGIAKECAASVVEARIKDFVERKGLTTAELWRGFHDLADDWLWAAGRNLKGRPAARSAPQDRPRVPQAKQERLVRFQHGPGTPDPSCFGASHWGAHQTEQGQT